MISCSVQSNEQSSVQNPLISSDEIPSAIQNISRELHNTYLYPDKAKVAADKLLVKYRAGDFNRQYDFSLFNHEITTTLIQSTNDSGFELIQQQPVTISFDNKTNADFPTKQHDAITTEILDHNIGYLKITGNFHYPNASDILAEQLRLLVGVDALIIDLRLADEAAIAIAQQLISYFIQSGTHIANVKFNHHVEALVAGTTVGFELFKQDFPLYIVNSSFVAGSWEFFGYTLQHFDKAVIVGEDTMGVGHIIKVVRISDTLSIRMNHAMITHPVSNENWDNHGVIPDYFFQGDAAFNKAYQLASGCCIQSSWRISDCSISSCAGKGKSRGHSVRKQWILIMRDGFGMADKADAYTATNSCM